jgi:hypothetical protein
VNAEFIAGLRAEIQEYIRTHIIVARESSTETRHKHQQEREMLRDRQTIRGKQAIVLSSECVDRNCGDCTDPDCCCECHVLDEEGEDEDVAD